MWPAYWAVQTETTPLIAEKSIGQQEFNWMCPQSSASVPPGRAGDHKAQKDSAMPHAPFTGLAQPLSRERFPRASPWPACLLLIWVTQGITRSSRHLAPAPPAVLQVSSYRCAITSLFIRNCTLLFNSAEIFTKIMLFFFMIWWHRRPALSSWVHFPHEPYTFSRIM